MWGEHRAMVYIPSISTYEMILRLCQSIASVDAMKEVREDMLSVGVVMNAPCGLACVWLLLSLRRPKDALCFVQQELTLKVSTSYQWSCVCVCVFRLMAYSSVSVQRCAFNLATPVMVCACVWSTLVWVSVLITIFVLSVFTVVS